MPAMGHLESYIIGNIAIGFIIPQNLVFTTETNTSLGDMGKKVEVRAKNGCQSTILNLTSSVLFKLPDN